MKLKESTFIKKNYNYIWAALVLTIALIYPDSLLRRGSLELFQNEKAIEEILKLAVFGSILGCFSGYKTKNRKYDFEFCVIFPVVEEILFRGVILLILVNAGLLKDAHAVVLSAMLFGVMHFQYFGLKKDAIRYVLFAFIGGYFLANLVLMTKSILPSIFIHMIFNTSAIVFSRYRNKR
jgi:hypothetical protein